MRFVSSNGVRATGSKRSIQLAKSAFQVVIEESSRRFPDETGGILVGRIVDDQPEVIIALGPGPRAVHHRSYFRRDGDYSQRELEAIYARFAGKYDCIGEWHSHAVLAGPSPRDRKSMRWIAQDVRYNLNHPLLIICRRTWRRTWKPVGYQYSGRLMQVPVMVTDMAVEVEGADSPSSRSL
jgi:integrative and conjugative element protein (TIGR02256 family)